MLHVFVAYNVMRARDVCFMYECESASNFVGLCEMYVYTLNRCVSTRVASMFCTCWCVCVCVCVCDVRVSVSIQ